MQSKIEQLFGYLDRGELEQLRNNISAEVVNTPRVSKLYQYDYSRGHMFPVCYFEMQYELLLFRAMLLKSYDAFKMLLDFGADLLLKEKFDRTDNEEKPHGQFRANRRVLETDIALTCVTNSKDREFIQITFDHICIRALYEQPIYIEFLIDHLSEVKLSKFRPEFLKIEVGNPLPRQFEDTDQYRDFLLENRIDISGFFFYKSQYLEYLTNPMSAVTKELLIRALRVCEFTLEETRQIYHSLPQEALKWVVVAHNPDVNPELRADMNEMFRDERRADELKSLGEVDGKVSSKKAKLSTSGSDSALSKPIQISPVDQQEYNHLEKRILLLQGTVRRLSDKKKLSTVERKDLSAAEKSLADCRARFLANPVYKKIQLEKNSRLSPDLPEAERESACHQNSSPSI